MPLNIRNEAVNELATKLAARKHITKTEAVKLARGLRLQFCVVFSAGGLVWATPFSLATSAAAMLYSIY